jgi:lipopolysaccharide/colanic/teichoic acid biosynthesis glycosyltransferase
MTTSMIPNLQNYYAVSESGQKHHSSYCTLQWRRGQLLVKSPGKTKQPYLATLEHEKSLVECLKHSPISLVTIDPKLGETRLKFWATACEQAHKPIFLRIPSSKKFPEGNGRILWWWNRIFDWFLALVLLLIISPVMAGLLLMMRIASPESVITREWHVGERGRLFRAIKLRTQNTTILDEWLHKYGLQNLPQLFNVVRGDMRLIGSYCWTLEDAVQLSLAEQGQLNELPGITSGWQVSTESNLLHLDGQTM